MRFIFYLEIFDLKHQAELTSQCVRAVQEVSKQKLFEPL